MFVGLTSVLFLAPRSIWICFSGLFAAGAAHEWARLICLPRKFGVAFVTVIATIVVAWHALEVPDIWSQAIYAFAAIFWIFGVPIGLWRYSMPTHFCIGSSVGTLVIVAAAIALIDIREQGAWFVIFILGVIWVSDSAAYFVGSAFGRHKLAPRISPGKTWEGAIGAMVFVGLYAVAWIYFSKGILPGRLTGPTSGKLMLIAMLLFIAILGVYGDLFESYLKRVAGVKDSGHILPGHGGILDRVDALLPALPVAALMFSNI